MRLQPRLDAGDDGRVGAQLGRIGQALAGQDGDFTVTAANTVLNSYGQLGVSVAPGPTPSPSPTLPT